MTFRETHSALLRAPMMVARLAALRSSPSPVTWSAENGLVAADHDEEDLVAYLGVWWGIVRGLKRKIENIMFESPSHLSERIERYR